ncbi:hypothetical protein [[Mycoplasma] testudinis]|uniref:hypothetical protein n=1 Tax=[Mycoplasma] testudinis TaxID=33924 RepID=UPI000480E11D|nr:hypothetical protein [[Mycoplasma] testudinis]
MALSKNKRFSKRRKFISFVLSATYVSDFLGQDPYSRSNVLSSGRMNIRLELEEVLKKSKTPIIALNLNS